LVNHKCKVFCRAAPPGLARIGPRQMHITNPEFDAALGDLKASFDKLQIPNKEQKELLAIVETTRPEIVQER